MVKKKTNKLFYTCLAFLFLSIFLSTSNDYFFICFPNYFVLLTSIIVAGSYICYSRNFFVSLDITSFFLLLFSIWVFLAITWAENPWLSFHGSVRYLSFVLLIFLFVPLFRLHPPEHYFSNSLLFPIVILSVVYFIYCCRQAHPPYGFCYPFGNPNIGSSVIAFGSILAMGNLWQAQHTNSLQKLNVVLQFFVLVWFLFVLYFLKSELVFLALCAALFVSFFIFSRYKKWCISFAIAAAILGYFILPQLVEKAWPSIEIRKYLWTDTLALIFYSFKSSILGWGSGSFFAIYPQFQSQESFSAIYASSFMDYPHSYTLEIASELGIVGVSLFFMVNITIVFKMVRQHLKKSLTIPDYIFFVAFLFFIFHSQVSIAFSLPQIQCIFAIVVARYISTYSYDKKLYVISPKILLVFLVIFLVVWKFAAWDMLHFHREYKKAVRVNEENGKKGIEEIVAVSVPLFEDYYTVHWRHSLGGILIDRYELSPAFVSESIYPFHLLEKLIPHGYGNYMLRQAVYCAKQGNTTEANRYFATFAQKNPFSNELWLYWTIANRNMPDALNVADNLSIFLSKYPDDGTLLMAQGLIYYGKNNNSEAFKYFQRALLWAKQNEKGNRAQGLKKIVLEFMEKVK